jgi:hypothetical protein
MTKRLQTVTPPRRGGLTLTITIDPLSVPRGARDLRRGGVHRTPRRPSRAEAKRGWRRQLAGEGGR